MQVAGVVSTRVIILSDNNVALTIRQPILWQLTCGGHTGKQLNIYDNKDCNVFLISNTICLPCILYTTRRIVKESCTNTAVLFYDQTGKLLIKNKEIVTMRATRQTTKSTIIYDET
jgi:hypothetical protein